MKDLLPYIASQRWFFGVRAEESLFFYSAKYLDREKLIKQEGYPGVVGTLLFPRAKDYPVRVFNTEEARQFHAESKRRILADVHVVNDYLSRDREVWRKIGRARKLEELLRLYGQFGALFFINFSLGMTLAKLLEEGGVPEESRPILRAHERWRNSVAFKEEKLGEEFFRHLRRRFPDLDTLELMKYATADEVLAPGANLAAVIEKRKRHGYIYAYLQDPASRGVIDDAAEMKLIQRHFMALLEKESGGTEIKGQVAFLSNKKIKGKVVVIKDKDVLKQSRTDLTGAILVAIQTTPHFIPYLKKVKAIVTDEGGITCHAAIVSREMKIPCIVGTKIATQVLKDGDEVEVNAAQGIVRIIKRKTEG